MISLKYGDKVNLYWIWLVLFRLLWGFVFVYDLMFKFFFLRYSVCLGWIMYYSLREDNIDNGFL